MAEQIESANRATSDPAARKSVLKQIHDGIIDDVLIQKPSVVAK